MKGKFLVFIFIISLSAGCRTSIIKKQVDAFHCAQIISRNLIAFQRADSNYFIPKDTFTIHGEFLKYLITNDSCCSDNIYLNWGNDTISRIYISACARQLRPYFTPELKWVTKDYFILERACATDCRAVLFFPLNNSEPVRDFQGIIGYDPLSYTVLAELDAEQQTEFEFIRALNVKTGKTKRIVFQHSSTAAQHLFSIDSCRINADEIYIKADLLDRATDKRIIEELKLKNDIGF